ncbi:hypothetical protein [Magnetospirillum sp. UT-4]|uniref:hypothetical protein n=1 Tax=Magnetospirillum sp. UT-4 TaxID=2681467 RepID=UPI0013813091|nr:hypothetical protein [Magnetospirillum sp. UT-4]CAA7625401.1 conserved hypothetical protein [Magnetospirillum sp. UT-4]
MTETRLTGTLPNMTVEILHQAEPESGAERMTIHLVARPDFQAALPLVGGLAQMPAMLALWQAPFQAWAQAVQAVAAPWMGAMGAGLPPRPAENAHPTLRGSGK